METMRIAYFDRNNQRMAFILRDSSALFDKACDPRFTKSEALSLLKTARVLNESEVELFNLDALQDVLAFSDSGIGEYYSISLDKIRSDA
jgi:hypothetical protein